MQTTTCAENGGGLTGNALKLIAIAAMTLDHVLWILFPGYQYIWWLVALHAVTLLFLSVQGMYMNRMYDELKDRPLYIVAEELNMDE